MYEETDDQGRHRYTVAQIATEFGVTPAHHLPLPRPAGRTVENWYRVGIG
jgi:hypothetical protein